MAVLSPTMGLRSQLEKHCAKVTYFIFSRLVIIFYFNILTCYRVSITAFNVCRNVSYCYLRIFVTLIDLLLKKLNDCFIRGRI